MIKLRRATALAGALMLAIAALAPGAAQAGHDNGTDLCSDEFDGTFKHMGSLALYRHGDPGNTRVGRVSVNGQRRRHGRKYRVCSVTIRRWHGKPKDTWAWVTRENAYYRLDRGPFYRYAGPVVGGLRAGQKLNGGGRLLSACASFGVTWAVGGRPQLGGGGCA